MAADARIPVDDFTPVDWVGSPVEGQGRPPPAASPLPACKVAREACEYNACMVESRAQVGTRGRIGLALLIVIAGALAAFAVASLPGIIHFWRAADYPGAARISDHSKLSLGNLSFRRDTSYRTRDSFPRVYNWYSTGQALGPEQQAQSNCILMERSYTVIFVLERYMGVTLCDTPSGRMIFVTRTVALRAS
jgi:hypothetical protein